jgi:hypothetical protein
MLAVGFLMPQAVAAPLDDALERIDQLESQRDALLAHADSLGSRLTAANVDDSPDAERYLRGAVELEEQAREIELEILLTRQRCRSLISGELEALRGSTDRQDRQRESELLDLLEGSLATDGGRGWVLVEPDTLDGYETLLDKRAYLADLQDRISASSTREVVSAPTRLSTSADSKVTSRRKEPGDSAPVAVGSKTRMIATQSLQSMPPPGGGVWQSFRPLVHGSTRS